MPNYQFYIPAEIAKEIKRIADYKRISPNEYCKQRVIASIVSMKRKPTTNI